MKWSPLKEHQEHSCIFDYEQWPPTIGMFHIRLLLFMFHSRFEFMHASKIHFWLETMRFFPLSSMLVSFSPLKWFFFCMITMIRMCIKIQFRIQMNWFSPFMSTQLMTECFDFSEFFNSFNFLMNCAGFYFCPFRKSHHAFVCPSFHFYIGWCILVENSIENKET